MVIDLQRLTETVQGIVPDPAADSAQEPTTFEVAGYPALESVASNVLAFFLDPHQPHGLGTLCLEALLAALELRPTRDDLLDVEVERESITELRQRIDIVVITGGWVVGIENKLYATLTNDLDHYATHLRGRAGERRWLGACLASSR